jgi:hypothetical protein
MYVDQSGTDSEFYQLSAGMQIELVHDSFPMAGDGFRAYAQKFPDLDIGGTLRDPFQHLPLAFAEYT